MAPWKKRRGGTNKVYIYIARAAGAPPACLSPSCPPRPVRGRRRGRQVRRAADNSNGRRRVAAAARTSTRRTRSSPLYARTTSAPRSSRVRRTAMLVALRPGAASTPQRAHRVCCLRRATPHRAPAALIGAIGACPSARPPPAARRPPRPPSRVTLTRHAAAGLTPPAGPAARMPAVRTGYGANRTGHMAAADGGRVRLVKIIQPGCPLVLGVAIR